MSVLTRLIPAMLATLVIPALLSAQSGTPQPGDRGSTTVGPAHGTVIVVGGGAVGPSIYSRFIEAAGGPDALILDVPNAGGASSYGEDAGGARALRAAGARNVHVLFTTDRTVANSAAFTAPIDHAGGVWFEGGRQYRLVDAYAGTRTEKAFDELLERGGVVAGSSAGATILGDFLVRGAPSDDNSIMDYPGYEKGFAFLRGVGIDQHVVARERLADLADSIMPRHPRLLGMSEDEGTAWYVRGDRATIVGRNKAFVYGGRDANDPGKPFLTLHPGDRYNLATRHVTHRSIEDSPLTMAFVNGVFQKFGGGSAGSATVLVAENGEVLVDASYGVPDQPRFMPTTTLPQFPLGEISDVFASLCAQLPEPAATHGVTESAAGTSVNPMSPFQRCLARQIAPPIGMHRTTADIVGQVSSDVDELYRFERGLENPRTWPNADVTKGWTAEMHDGATWLVAYGMAGGKRDAFVRMPDRHAVIIVLTDDPTADAKGLADSIARRMAGTR